LRLAQDFGGIFVHFFMSWEEINDQPSAAAAKHAIRARNQIGSTSYLRDINTAKTMIPIAILTS
jgi:hypothetical protein